MADEKKSGGKPEGKSDGKPATSSGGAGSDPFVEIVSLVVVLMLAAAPFNGAASYFSASAILKGDFSAFTVRGILLRHSSSVDSLANPIGEKIVSINQTSVYDAPGGKIVGKQNINARGKILQGPVQINGVEYWYVDYDSGTDGWVKNDDIVYLNSEPNFFERILISILTGVWLFKIIIALASILFIMFIIYLFRELSSLRSNEKKLLYPERVASIEPAKNPTWERILAQIESQNENDWRSAIIEADVMLEKLADSLGLPGDTLAEKLKSVAKGDFTTVDNAWEAHNVRNRIAHDGMAYMLTQREVKRVIGLYESVFTEFKII